MKRHVLGLALFSSIVGAAVFLSWLFYTPAMPEVVSVVPEEVVSTKKVSCRLTRPGDFTAPKVIQSVFNLRTKQLQTELLIEGAAPTNNWVGVTLHFFSKNGRGTRYLGSETFAVAPMFDAESRATHSVVSSFSWLDNLSSYENLYVVAERGSGFGQANKPSGFDETNAHPVLLMREN